MDSNMPEGTESSNVVDTHRIISKIFNTQFNWFIAKYSTSNASRGTLHIFARMLDEWRLSLARRSTISMNEFQAEIDKLIAIYRLAIARSDSLSVEEFADFRRLLESWSVFFSHAGRGAPRELLFTSKRASEGTFRFDASGVAVFQSGTYRV
ncbi:MAG: hypothetical protein QW096_10505 [Thermofilaceae archaeon]